MGLWLIWKGLCDEKHKSIKLKLRDLERDYENYIEAYVEARKQAACQAKLLPLEGSSRWARPRKGRFRLDVDYAMDEKNGTARVGAILRNDSQCIIFVVAQPVSKASSILHGELKALMHGIVRCVEEDISPVEAYTDSMIAVIAVADGKDADSILCAEMMDFFEMVEKLNVLSVNHVRREANRAAHELASLAKSLTATCVWHDNWPRWLLDIVEFDSS